MSIDEKFYDFITNELLIEPVRIKSNGKIINCVVNKSTVKKLTRCPFTQSTNFEIVVADDIMNIINDYKINNPCDYQKMISDYNNQYIKINNDFILNIKKILKYIHNIFLEPINKNLKYFTYNLDNYYTNGWNNLHIKTMKEILDKEPLKLYDDIYIHFNIIKINNIPFEIKFIKVRKTS